LTFAGCLLGASGGVGAFGGLGVFAGGSRIYLVGGPGLRGQVLAAVGGPGGTMRVRGCFLRGRDFPICSGTDRF